MCIYKTGLWLTFDLDVFTICNCQRKDLVSIYHDGASLVNSNSNYVVIDSSSTIR